MASACWESDHDLTAAKQSRSRACGGFPPPSLSSASTPLPPAGSSVPMVARGRGLSHTDREVSLRVRHVVAQQKGRKVGEMVILGFTQTALRTLAKVCLNPVPAPFTAEQAKRCRRSVSVDSSRHSSKPSNPTLLSARTRHVAGRRRHLRHGEARRGGGGGGRARRGQPCLAAAACLPCVSAAWTRKQAGRQAGEAPRPSLPAERWLPERDITSPKLHRLQEDAQKYNPYSHSLPSHRRTTTHSDIFSRNNNPLSLPLDLRPRQQPPRLFSPRQSLRLPSQCRRAQHLRACPLSSAS